MSGIDPRPQNGVSVIEASAGTGKTHAVTTLAVTAMGDGVPLDQLLFMTFSRAATGELRRRVWQRLVSVEAELGLWRNERIEPTDEVALDLGSGDDATTALRHDRLRAAVADFDAATITTLHGFCHDVLSRLGSIGDLDRDATFLEDDRDLIDQIVDDLLVQRFHRSVDYQLTQEEARSIARAVTTHHHATIVPEKDLRALPHLRRARFALAIRDRVERRKRELAVLGYDDLLTKLDDELTNDADGTVKRRLRERFGFVVVDEFQDTDSVQWNILRLAFGDGDTRLVLVGDPKQAIYSFRGADVLAYLNARSSAAGDLQRLDVNWRSDADVLTALDAVFGDAELGHPEIRYQRTSATGHHVETGLVTEHEPHAFRLRQVRRDMFSSTDLTHGVPKAAAALRLITEDLAADIARRLRHDATLVDRHRDGTATSRPLQARDIAVLVRSNPQAFQVRDALRRAGVDAVVNATGSVFASEAARHWTDLLQALETPASTARVRTTVLGPFFGWTAHDLVSADEASWDRVHDRIHSLRAALADDGPSALWTRAMSDGDLPAALLSAVGGRRLLTDLDHVGRLLHEFAITADSAPTALLGWLGERRARAERETETTDRQRQLDSDADAVQVWTTHRSKGLEYPIVYLPFLWKPPWIPDDDIPYFHEVDDDGAPRRCIDVGGTSSPHFRAHQRTARADLYGEEMRLAYVAATRARHQVVAWWAPTRDANSPLGRLVFTDARTADLASDSSPDDRERSVFDRLAADSGGTIHVEEAGSDDVDGPPRPEPATDLAVRRFDRTVDLDWKRTSYSGLVALAHTGGGGAAAAPEHDDRGLEDEGVVGPDGPENTMAGSSDGDLETTLRAVPSVFGELAGGARFGTMVHEVLENVDFAVDDLESEVRAAVAARAGASDDVVPGLVAALRTPLGATVGDVCLSDVGRADRLDELHFEFPLAGGDRPSGTVTMAALADVLARTLDPGDVLADYPRQLSQPELAQSVHGYLSGSIDLVARVGGRFVVADYKTNWLGVEGEELSTWHYRPEALRAAMIRAHYPLQALLYSVALHRFLRARLRGYSPDEHLGGVLYLFLRGMVGPDTPRVRTDGVGDAPCGVFVWNPPPGAILAVSDLLDTGVGS